MGACLGIGRAKFECILHGLGGLDGSPEGRTGGGGMGRAMRAGVRVGLFVCLCLCRERPPCEGLIPSFSDGRGVRGENLGFPECAACFPWRHGQRSVASEDSIFAQKKVKPEENEVCYTSFFEDTTNRGVGLWTVRTKRWSDRLSSDRYWSFATTFTAWRVQWRGSLDELPQRASSLNRNKSK